ncbi:MAG: aldolase catalytic domain-containing protein [Planctomycetes bacterium]|nr:aldolase catalytic domain-containing protein [Planctomycetota bacterium]
MFRKEIKVMDCTVRDGGLMNNWQFDDDFVRSVYQACVAGGVDYMEIGYRSSESAYSRDEVGPWKFCDNKDLERIVGANDTELKLSAMADIGRIALEDIPQASNSLIDMMRVACYTHQVDKGIALAEHCLEKGYEVTLNIMAVSTVMERDLDEALEDIAKTNIPIVYLVDSFGSMYCEQIQSLMKKYTAKMPGKTIGYHGHNNMQLAFANTIETIIQGANFLDGSILGVGRGAGNCPTELLLSFLKNPKYKMRPILDVIQNKLVPLQQEIDWGYHMPYMLVGSMNEHPRSAMKWMNSEQKDDTVAFYDSLMEDRATLE